MKSNVVALLITAWLGFWPPAARASMIGVTWDGQVLSINETTAAGSPIGASGLSGLNALARNNAGVYYSATAIPSISHNLVTIDPVTGLGSVVATLNFGAIEPSVRALAFSPGGALYAIHHSGGLYDTSDLYLVDPVTGVGTLVGNTGAHGIQGLTFSPTGTLYAWDLGGFIQENSIPVFSPGLGLMTIDPATGVASDVNAAVGNTSPLQSMAFSASGTLYGISTGIYTRLTSIDLATGATTLLGSQGDITGDIRGLECITCPAAAAAAVPEPSPAILLGLGLVILACRMWRGQGAEPKRIQTRW